MENLGNKYALCALRERRSELAGELITLERKLRGIREAMSHVDGVLRLFDPEADPKAIKAKPYRRVKLFGQGKLNRMILDALRATGRPMSTAEVTAAVGAAQGFGEAAAKGLRNRVRANLFYLWKARATVSKAGERETAMWQLARL